MKSAYNKFNFDESSYCHQMYKNVFSRVRSFVLNNSGTVDDALDVFQDTMITVLLMNRNDEELNRLCQYSLTYVIAKRVWFRRLREINRHEEFLSNNEEIMRDLFMLSNEEQYSHSEIDVILYESIQKLGNKYKNVILTSLKVKNNKEGAKLLNYTDRYYAKMLCVSRKLLRERILKHHLVLENMR